MANPNIKPSFQKVLDDNELSFEQFMNVLSFLYCVSPSDGIPAASPEYVVEKFKRFLGPVNNIPSHEVTGLHALLKLKFIPIYLDKWCFNDLDVKYMSDNETLDEITKIYDLVMNNEEKK